MQIRLQQPKTPGRKFLRQRRAQMIRNPGPEIHRRKMALRKEAAKQ